MWDWFKRKKTPNELSVYRQYKYSDGYSGGTKLKKSDVQKIISLFKSNTINKNCVSIESFFNGIYYPFFDLDDKHLDLFKKVYSDTPHVIFISSVEQYTYYFDAIREIKENVHYWAFLDVPYEKVDDIFFDINWKNINDQNYVEFSREYDKLFIRGLYENDRRKPNVYEKHGELSENFSLFLDKLNDFYNKEAFELSILRYKDPDMLVKYNRIKKLGSL